MTTQNDGYTISLVYYWQLHIVICNFPRPSFIVIESHSTSSSVLDS